MPQTAINYSDPKYLCFADAGYWANYNQIILSGNQPFSFFEHEYQQAILSENPQKQCIKKAAQLGFTEIFVLRTLHGMRYQRYPAGALYLFPTQDDVTDFSKGRFQPLLADNPEAIGRFIKDTDAANIKRIGKSMLYFRGARATGKIEGIKKTSSKLKTIPVDLINYDEFDEMDPDMVDLASERIGHSKIREENKISTPSIPDWGIDREYQLTDQQIWIIRC